MLARDRVSYLRLICQSCEHVMTPELGNDVETLGSSVDKSDVTN